MITQTPASRELRFKLDPNTPDQRVAFVNSVCALWKDARAGRRPYSRLFLPRWPQMDPPEPVTDDIIYDRAPRFEWKGCGSSASVLNASPDRITTSHIGSMPAASADSPGWLACAHPPNNSSGPSP